MDRLRLVEIERQVRQFSPEDQLWLIERLVHGLRTVSPVSLMSWDAEMSAMAADPEIQSELQKINEEFAVTEMDGLEAI